MSLVEVVVTITLLVIVVVPTLAAVRGSIRASATNRELAQVETALINAAEAVTAAAMSCASDAYRSSVAEALDELPGDVTLDRLDVDHAHDGDDPTDDAHHLVWHPRPCPGDTPRFGLVQRVRVQVSGSSGVVQRQLDVLKTNV